MFVYVRQTGTVLPRKVLEILWDSVSIKNKVYVIKTLQNWHNFFGPDILKFYVLNGAKAQPWQNTQVAKDFTKSFDLHDTV